MEALAGTYSINFVRRVLEQDEFDNSIPPPPPIPDYAATETPTFSPEDTKMLIGLGALALSFLFLLLILIITLHCVAYNRGMFTSWKLSFLNFKDFHSRTRRRDYIAFSVVNFLIHIDLGFLDGLFGTEVMLENNIRIGIMGILYSFFVLIPSIAIMVRRLHDQGRSGWWILLSFIPLGPLVLFVLLVFVDSQVGTNAYGENPKGVVFSEGVVLPAYVVPAPVQAEYAHFATDNAVAVNSNEIDTRLIPDKV